MKKFINKVKSILANMVNEIKNLWMDIKKSQAVEEARLLAGEVFLKVFTKYNVVVPGKKLFTDVMVPLCSKETICEVAFGEVGFLTEFYGIYLYVVNTENTIFITNRVIANKIR